MSWKFQISKGLLFDPTGKVVWSKAYAGGNEGKDLEGVNNPAMCDQHNIGPLPVGLYVMTQLVMQHPRLGPYVILLTPDAANEMYGRGDFRVHGDRTDPKLVHAASEGCIIVPRFVRELMWKSEDHVIEVIA
jgi:hypothetical protein